MKAIVHIFLLFLFCSLFTNGSGQQAPGLPFITNFLPADYQKGPQNFAVIQNQLGFMVFGNDRGVMVFNGEQWITTPVANRTEVHSLAEDATGRLYVGAQGDFGFMEESSDYRNYTSLLPKVEERYRDFNDVWAIHIIGEEVVFRSTRYIFIFDKRQDKISTIPLQSYSHRSFVINGEVWVTQAGLGMSRLVNGDLQLLLNGNVVKDESINSGFNYPGGRALLVSEKRGLLIWDNGKVSPLPSVANEILIGQNVFGQLLPDGTYALATRKNGVVMIRPDGSLRAIFGKREGLSDPSVWAVASDRYNGNVWLATNNGVSVIELESPFTTLQSKVGLEGQFYTFEEFKGHYYTAGALGIFRQSSKTSPWSIAGYQSFEQMPGMDDQSWHLYVDSIDLLASSNQGIFQLINDKFVNIGFQDRAWYLLLLRKFPGYILANTVSGILLLKKKGSQYVLARTLSQKPESLYYFTEDHVGNIWVSSSTRGVYRIQFKQGIEAEPEFTLFNSQHGLPQSYGIRPFLINDEIVFGTVNGIYHFNEKLQKFESCETLNQQFFQANIPAVELLVEDKQGNVIGTYRTNPDNITKGFKAEKVGSGKYRTAHDIFRKVQARDINGITFTGYGNLVLATADGLVHMKASEFVLPDFPVHITTIEAIRGDSTIAIDSLQELSFDWNSVKIKFASMGFSGHDDASYQYKLEGFDKQWSPPTPLAQKEYTNLPPGRFVFKVRSTNSYNHQSQEALFSFSILAPWYQSWWAYAILLLVGGFAFVKLSQWRSSKLLLANARLEEKIRQRTLEIQEQHNQILEKNQQLENQNAEIEAQKENLESAHRHMEFINQNLEGMVEVRTQELKEAYNDLLVLKKELDTFIYRSSHDIKGPLLRLLGLTMVAKADVADKKALHYLSLLEEEINVTNRMLQKLITYQHLKTSKPTFKNISIKKLINKQLESLQNFPRFSEYKIDLLVSDHLTIETDEELLSIAIQNLLENSLIYSGIQPPAIVIRIEEAGDMMRIFISDNGKGIDETLQSKVFEMFFRGSELSRGAGIGLSLAREATHQLQGTLTLESLPGWVTTFCISVPVNLRVTLRKSLAFEGAEVG